MYKRYIIRVSGDPTGPPEKQMYYCAGREVPMEEALIVTVPPQPGFPTIQTFMEIVRQHYDPFSVWAVEVKVVFAEDARPAYAVGASSGGG